MKKMTRNATAGTAALLLAGLGVSGAVMAQAQTSHPAAVHQISTQQSGAEQSDGDGEADPAKEAAEGPEAVEENDGPDQGPDANPNQPGHQDADESGESK
jgi:hypothetical protein